MVDRNFSVRNDREKGDRRAVRIPLKQITETDRISCKTDYWNFDSNSEQVTIEEEWVAVEDDSYPLSLE